MLFQLEWIGRNELSLDEYHMGQGEANTTYRQDLSESLAVKVRLRHLHLRLASFAKWWLWEEQPNPGKRPRVNSSWRPTALLILGS